MLELAFGGSSAILWGLLTLRGEASSVLAGHGDVVAASELEALVAHSTTRT